MTGPTFQTMRELTSVMDSLGIGAKVWTMVTDLCEEVVVLVATSDLTKDEKREVLELLGESLVKAAQP